jgi:hypothetical protein
MIRIGIRFLLERIIKQRRNPFFNILTSESLPVVHSIGVSQTSPESFCSRCRIMRGYMG